MCFSQMKAHSPEVVIALYHFQPMNDIVESLSTLPWSAESQLVKLSGCPLCVQCVPLSMPIQSPSFPRLLRTGVWSATDHKKERLSYLWEIGYLFVLCDHFAPSVFPRIFSTSYVEPQTRLNVYLGSVSVCFRYQNAMASREMFLSKTFNVFVHSYLMFTE